GQAGGVIEQMANTDGLAIRREIRKNVGEARVVAQPAVMRQQHYRYGGELLGAGGQAEIGLRADGCASLQIAHAESALVDGVAVFLDQHRQAGLIRRERREDIVEFVLQRGGLVAGESGKSKSSDKSKKSHHGFHGFTRIVFGHWSSGVRKSKTKIPRLRAQSPAAAGS